MLLKAWAFKAIVAFLSTAVGTFSMQESWAGVGTAWESEKKLLRQPVLLTFATTDKFCDSVPTSRIDTIVSQVNDVNGEDTDIELSLLSGDKILHTHVPD